MPDQGGRGTAAACRLVSQGAPAPRGALPKGRAPHPGSKGHIQDTALASQ